DGRTASRRLRDGPRPLPRADGRRARYSSGDRISQSRERCRPANGRPDPDARRGLEGAGTSDDHRFRLNSRPVTADREVILPTTRAARLRVEGGTTHMASEGPSRAGAPSLTSLPQFEDIPRSGDGLDPERTREAFDAFRRHVSQLQAQLRVLQAAGRSASIE